MSGHPLQTTLALLAGLLAGCGADELHEAPAPSPARRLHFEDVALEVGLGDPTWCGREDKPHILESGGTGLALFDYDGDGDLDLYLVNGWRLEGSKVAERGRNTLHRNRGDGTFEDVTEEAGVGDDGWGCGVGVGDFDGDGNHDLFVANFGPDVLYRNRGDGSFEAVDDAPGIDGWSACPVFFDGDGDGDEDLFVSAYIDCTLEQVLNAEPSLEWKGQSVMLGPFGLEGKGNRYFENLGGGRFRDATSAAGLEDVGLYYSFGVVAADLDDDGDLDLYVANDSNPNYLYRNDGEGHFQDVGLWSGCALDENGQAQAGMGIATGDIDEDGRLDLFVTHFAEDSSTLYANRGDCLFEDVSRPYGLSKLTYGPLSWGTCMLDLDNDGSLELFVVNGHLYPQADLVENVGYAQTNQVLTLEGRRFHDASPEAGPGLAVTGSSRGLACGDLDGDGDLDMVISNIDAPPTLLRNDSTPSGAWLLVDAPGALRVAAVTGGRRRVRHAVRGGSFNSACDQRLHFGLGAVESVDELRISWDDGTESTLKNVAVNRVLRVTR